MKANCQFVSSGFEIGINAGTLIYQGDLTPKLFGYTNSLRPSVGIYASKPLDDFFSVRANLMRGWIGADESTYAAPAWRRSRNFSFSSPVTELSALLVWNPMGKIDRLGMQKLSPYFLAGAGLTLLNVHRDWSRMDRSVFDNKSSASMGLAIDSLHRTPVMVAVFPVGAGLRYRFSDRVFATVEAVYRFTLSDYIDGFKYASDPSSKDYYYGLSAGIGYSFGYHETACPRVTF